jgi:hypothetical protein
VLADEGERNRALTAQSGMSLKPDRGGYGAVFASPGELLVQAGIFLDGWKFAFYGWRIKKRKDIGVINHMRLLCGWRSRHFCKNRDKPIKYTVRVTGSGFSFFVSMFALSLYFLHLYR